MQIENKMLLWRFTEMNAVANNYLFYLTYLVISSIPFDATISGEIKIVTTQPHLQKR